MRFRTYHAFRAWVTGYFWLPCPACGQKFGGHEKQDSAQHQDSIPTVLPDGTYRGSAKLICPDCTSSGVGDRAWEKIGVSRLY